MNDYRQADIRRQRALERLVTQIADDMAKGRTVSPSKRREYNTLKTKLGQEGRMI